MKKVEYGLCALLALFALGHLAGTLTGYKPGTDVFVWSLSATFFVFAIVFLHVLRLRRPGDGLIRLGAIVFTAIWAVLALMFGWSQGNILDPRVLLHAAASVALMGTSLMRR